jgi:hypothetical protein
MTDAAKTQAHCLLHVSKGSYGRAVMPVVIQLDEESTVLGSRLW